jgi:hypothetical protein
MLAEESIMGGLNAADDINSTALKQLHHFRCLRICHPFETYADETTTMYDPFKRIELIGMHTRYAHKV